MARPADRGRDEPPTIAESIGGPLGMAETALPAVAYVTTYTVSGSDTTISAAVAVGLALVLTVARLIRRESPQQALSGLVGVAFAAFIATRSGRAEDFFLPGLFANAAYAGAFLVSIALGRPLIGYIVGAMTGDAKAWRKDPARVRVYTRATWLWAGLFALRLAVQLPLWAVGAVVALGVARTAMGIPLFALGVWLTWRMVRPPQEPAPA